jgi:hypothetical protein
MSASQIRFGAAALKLRSSRFGDREVVTAVGSAHPSWPRHDGPDTVAAHQSLDAAATRPAALSPQPGMDAGAAIAAIGIAVNPLDIVDEFTVSGGSRALRARPPGIVASRRDAEHAAHDLHRIVRAAIFDEAKSHFWTPAMGDQWLECLLSIPIIAIVPFAAIVWAVRRAAPTNLVRAGAFSGLVAGGVSALAYALHCTDDSLPFVALWYGGTIVLCTLAGAILGPRLLRW